MKLFRRKNRLALSHAVADLGNWVFVDMHKTFLDLETSNALLDVRWFY